MSDTLADILPDLSPLRKRSGLPTVHRDGTCSWRWAGQWHRTQLGQVAPLAVFLLPDGPTRHRLVDALHAREWPEGVLSVEGMQHVHDEGGRR
jgi:hypothetical protein